MSIKPGPINFDSPQFAIGIAGDSPFAGIYYSREMTRTPGTDKISYRHDRMPLTIESRIIALSGSAVTAELGLRNEGEAPLSISLYALLVTGAIDYTAYIPQIGGRVEPVRESNYIAYAPGQLTATFMIVQGDGAGLALAQDKPLEDESKYRTGVLVNGLGIPRTSGPAGSMASEDVGSSVTTQAGPATDRDLGGVACFVEDTVLPAGRSMVFGPYILAEYQGGWTAGAARLRELRRPRPMRQRPTWMRSILAAGELHGRHGHPDIRTFADLVDQSRDLANIGAPLFMLWAWWDRTELETQPNENQFMFWRYAFRPECADAVLGGDDGLREAIVRIREAGSKVLLYIDPWQIARDSKLGKFLQGKEWQTLDAAGKTTVGGDGEAWLPCPALPEVRRWIVEGVVDTFRRYRPDGFFIDEMCAIGYTNCHNASHNHPHPYIWSAGLYDLCKELRAALDEIDREAVLLSEGGSELLREHLDGYLAHTHGWTGYRHSAPVTRAVVGDIGIFDSADGHYEAERSAYEYFLKMGVMPWDVEHVAAIKFISGIPYYTSLKGAGRTHPIFAKHHAYRLAYPEMFKGEICADQPVFDPSTVVGTLFQSGESRVLAVANTRGDYSLRTWTKVSMPLGRQLFNRVQAEFVPIVDGIATLALGPYEVAAYEVVH